MQSFRTLVFQFYKPYIYYLLFFTCLSLTLLLSKGAIAFVLALPLKLVGTVGAIAYQHTFYQHEYFYYRNAGVQVRRLYLYAYIPDFVVFFILSGLSILVNNQYA
jgi:hypothetical protein